VQLLGTRQVINCSSLEKKKRCFMVEHPDYNAYVRQESNKKQQDVEIGTDGGICTLKVLPWSRDQKVRYDIRAVACFPGASGRRRRSFLDHPRRPSCRPSGPRGCPSPPSSRRSSIALLSPMLFLETSPLLRTNDTRPALPPI
jgi:hypothetical protein